MLLRELTSPKDTVEEGIVDIATKVADKATQGVNSILGKIENWYTSQKDENDLAWAEVELLLKPYAQELKDLIQDKRDMQMLMFMLQRNQINKGFIRNLFDKIKRKGLRAVYKMEKEFGGFATEDLDEGPTWARSGKKVVRKYRCTAGPRKNRIVSKLQQCFAAPNVKKRMALKRIKARLGSRITRKAKKTKRMNPASIRVQRLNKATRR
jgi:hypothetical protein